MANGRQHVRTTVLPGGSSMDLWIEDGSFVGGPLDCQTIYSGGFGLAGLVDAHAHLALASPAADGDEDGRVRASARAQLESGVLSLREPGSPDRASRRLSGDDLPTVITAGRFLAPPHRYFPGLAREVSDDDLPSVALDELSRSHGWVKLIGDFFDDEGVFTANFSADAVEAAADAVHGAGGRITMHAMIPESIQQAIDAGLDGIEHGSIVEDGQVEQMAAAGITWTPTALIDEILSQSAEGMLGPAGAPFLVEGMRSHGDAIRRAHELGVRVLAGTDAGMNPHGVVAHEIRLLNSFGISAEDALAAGSWEARSYLGLAGVEVGAPADLVIFPDDPRDDLTVLDHPVLIMRGGRLVNRK